MKKRLLATLLALCLIVGLFPAMALADGVEGDKKGTCGATGNEDKVTWALTENKDNPATYTLTISGSGAMADYSVDSSSDNRPWSLYANNITKVVIQGITLIGEQAFKSMNVLTEVEFDTLLLETISVGAFQSCASLDKIEIPKSVVTIEGKAFRDCTGLKTVTFETGSQLTTLGGTGGNVDSSKDTFVRCSSLVSISLPDSVTTIGRGCFDGCTSLTAVDVPDGVSYIGEAAFRNTAITEFTVPSALTSLESQVLAGTKIKTLDIPDSINTIGVTLCSGCQELETATVGAGVETIPYWVFQNCSKLESIVLKSVTDLSCWAFAGCTSLQAVVNYSPEPMKLTIGTWSSGDNLTWRYDPYNSASNTVTTYLSSTLATDSGYPERYLLGLGHEGTNTDAKHNVVYLNGGTVDVEKSGLTAVEKNGYLVEWFKDSGFTQPAEDNAPQNGVAYYAKWTECTEHVEEEQVTTPATCDTEGVRTYTCKKCGAIRTETIPALDHSYGEWAVTVTPTTTAAGQLTRTCARDASHIDTYTLPALNTTEYTYTVTKQAGVYEAGEAEYTITVGGQAITITVVLPALPLFPPVNPTTPSKPVEPDEPDTPVIPGTLPFVDVSANDWYYEDVAYVYAQGIMTGSTASTFAPNNAMTRAMVWTVLGRMSGENVEGGSPWYALAQSWAVSAGVSDGTGPNDSITREQLVTMLYRQAGSPAVGVSELALLGRFTDGESVSAWAEEAMAWAVFQGILTGDGDLLNPQAAATRAQVAAILARYCENTQK